MNPNYTVKPVVGLKIRVVRPDDQWWRVFPTTTFFDSANTPMLTGDNFAEWKENVLLTLGCMDLDLALRGDASPKPTESRMPIVKSNYKQWARSDRLSIMFIKSRSSPSIRDVIPTCDEKAFKHDT
nr:hypothetical protein [Tanacetum cinerariifolium]